MIRVRIHRDLWHDAVDALTAMGCFSRISTRRDGDFWVVTVDLGV